MNPDELQAGIDYIRALLTAAEERSANPDTPLSDEEWAEVNAGIDWIADAERKLENHARLAGEVERGKGQPGDRPSFNVSRSVTPLDVVRDRSASESEIRDAVVQTIESREIDNIDDTAVRKIVRRHVGPDMGRETREWARNLVERAQDVYVSAFAKVMTGRNELLSAEERASLQVGSNALGGYLLPTHLDPTIILTNDGSSNAVRGISRVVTLTEGNVWNGITSAGITASFDAELTEVSDDSPTVGNPQITVHKAQAFAQASIEAFQDINGLASDLLMLFADAKDRLEGAKHCTGSGTNEPFGIFTALDANTNVEITSTTAATIGKVDLNSVYRQVPVRWRGRSSWLMNPLYSLAIHDLGTAVSASYSGDLREGPAGTILNRPVVESDDAPSTQTTTVADNELILGDFSNYVIVDKPGSMSVEFIPHMFNTATNLPDGRRGWYCYWRTGADSVNDLAFRLLQDKTSA